MWLAGGWNVQTLGDIRRWVGAMLRHWETLAGECTQVQCLFFFFFFNVFQCHFSWWWETLKQVGGMFRHWETLWDISRRVRLGAMSHLIFTKHHLLLVVLNSGCNVSQCNFSGVIVKISSSASHHVHSIHWPGETIWFWFPTSWNKSKNLTRALRTG